jgi:hypothetical protein
MKATEFDEGFDAGEDMSAHVDWTKPRRLNVEARRMNVDLPTWGVAGLDRQAGPEARHHPPSADQDVDR